MVEDGAGKDSDLEARPPKPGSANREEGNDSRPSSLAAIPPGLPGGLIERKLQRRLATRNRSAGMIQRKPDGHRPANPDGTPSPEGAGAKDGEKEAGTDDRNSSALPAFPEDKLRPIEDLPLSGEETTRVLASLATHDGPQVVGPLPVRVAGAVIRRESYFFWVEQGRIAGWMPVIEVPAGATRRGCWWIYSGAAQIEVGRRYPEDALSNREHLGTGSKTLGIQPDPKIAERRSSAARDLNHDIDCHLAKGLSLSEARAETRKTAVEIAWMLGMAYFQAFAVAIGSMSQGHGAMEEAAALRSRARPWGYGGRRGDPTQGGARGNVDPEDAGREDRASAAAISDGPKGASGPSQGRGRTSGRPFAAEKAGGPIRSLDYRRVKITAKGVDAVEAHVRRFEGPGKREMAMVERLRK